MDQNRKRKRPTIYDKYAWDETKCIGQGTYGIVYRAVDKANTSQQVAIKRFKNTKEGEGISLTAFREITLLKELNSIQHPNIVKLVDIFLLSGEKLFMVFDYAEYDLFEVIRYHQKNGPISPYTIKSLMWQLLDGINCLHENWIIHRDIKPSNILVMGEGKEMGTVKIGDFGLARIFQSPLRPLSDNGVVVTIWYRSPELLLGSKHYTCAVDIWAIGCIFAELIKAKALFLVPMNQEQQNTNAFQSKQVEKIFSIMGTPTVEQWPDLVSLPEYPRLAKEFPKTLPCALNNTVTGVPPDSPAMDLLRQMLIYDPTRRISASKALEHPYFKENPLPGMNSFVQNSGNIRTKNIVPYPKRQPTVCSV